MLKKLTVMAIGLTATGSVALAQQPIATTGPVKGTVMVNHGSGFVRVAANTPLAGGDRLMARPGARATVKYADGCVVKVKAGSTVTIGTESPCRNMSAQVPDERPAGTLLLPGAVPGASPLLLGGLLLAGGGVAAAIVLTSTSNRGNNFIPTPARGGGGGGGGQTPVSP